MNDPKCRRCGQNHRGICPDVAHLTQERLAQARSAIAGVVRPSPGPGAAPAQAKPAGMSIADLVTAVKALRADMAVVMARLDKLEAVTPTVTPLPQKVTPCDGEVTPGNPLAVTPRDQKVTPAMPGLTKQQRWKLANRDKVRAQRARAKRAACPPSS